MRLPGPSDLLRVTEQGYDAATRAIALVPRLISTMAEVDVLLRRVTSLIAAMETTQQRAAAAVDHVADIESRIDSMLSRTTDVVERTSAIVDRTTAVVERTEGVVGRASHLTAQVEPLLAEFQPTLHTLAPILARLAETTTTTEVDAVVKLVDALPELVDKLDADILPVLDTLATVAPDLRDLLDVSKELNELIGSVPGLGRVKRKIEEKQELQDTYRADEEPASAPERRRNGHADTPADTPA